MIYVRDAKAFPSGHKESGSGAPFSRGLPYGGARTFSAFLDVPSALNLSSIKACLKGQSILELAFTPPAPLSRALDLLLVLFLPYQEIFSKKKSNVTGQGLKRIKIATILVNFCPNLFPTPRCVYAVTWSRLSRDDGSTARPRHGRGDGLPSLVRCFKSLVNYELLAQTK